MALSLNATLLATHIVRTLTYSAAMTPSFLRVHSAVLVGEMTIKTQFNGEFIEDRLTLSDLSGERLQTPRANVAAAAAAA